jgi:DNA polymerase-1
VPKKFVLIDAHSLIYRSYYAFIKNPLKNSKGDTTSGIFGFLNTLEKIKQHISTDYMGLAFDAPGETFRDEVYGDYKATRPPTPPDLPFQVAKVKEIIQHLGIPQFELEGYEADDILATFAKVLQKSGSVYIVTSDKDLFQLVSENIYIYDAYKNIIYDRDKVVEKYRIMPERIADYLALTGDVSDNIPGVPGIGPKRAVEILKKYAKFEDAVEQEKKIRAHREQAMLSHRLTVLECHVPLRITPQSLLVNKTNTKELMPVLLDLELHSYIKILGQTAHKELTSKGSVELADASPGDIIGIFENGDDDLIICLGEDNLFKAKINDIDHLLGDNKIVKVGYDLKNLFKRTPITSPVFDIRIASWLIDPNRRSYKLEDLVLHYLNEYVAMTPLQAAQCIYRLYPILKKTLASHCELYENIEAPLINVLASMEKRGIKIDLEYFNDLSGEFKKEISRVEKKIYELGKMPFNINSPKQLSHVLFEKLKLTPVKKGKSHYSTSVEVLQHLSHDHPLPAEILKYRSYAKIKSAFIDPLIAAAQSGRIHTTFNQAGTSTGRLSSSNPNIQNIPIRTQMGRRIRQGFIAEKNYSLISADYSQIELRLLAHMSEDRNLIAAFQNNEDIHRHTAALIYNITEEDVDDKKRRMAKIVNYGLIYGMSDFGLVQRLDIPREEAVQFIDSYYNLYPGVEKWRGEAIRQAEQRGYTETLLGRRRPLPDIDSRNHNLREFSKRAAINTPIQGTAADLIKIAMINVEKELKKEQFKRGLLLTIHDELVFEIENNRLKQAEQIIKTCMEQALDLKVRIIVAIKSGNNWDEVH